MFHFSYKFRDQEYKAHYFVLFQFQDTPEKAKPKSKADSDSDGWLSKDKDPDAGGDSGFVKSSATLVVCPASLVHQWAREIERRVSASALKVVLYHGPNRERSLKVLAGADVVLTTYNLISKEVSMHRSLFIHTINPRLEPRGLINFMARNRLGSNRERVEIEILLQ